MAGNVSPEVHVTVENIFDDFKGRRAGIIKALTEDVENLYQKCDPEKDGLCLYGFPNGTWEVMPPAEMLPSELPEPVLGINFGRDGTNMQDDNWLSVVAAFSDSWILSVAFHLAAVRFGKIERNRLFQMINHLPTISEVVSAAIKKTTNVAAAARDNISKNKYSVRMESLQSIPEHKEVKMSASKEEVKSREEEEGDDQKESLCGACGYNYNEDGFWICCDICNKWFHGTCVNITPSEAERIKQYKCPTCSNKRTKMYFDKR
ncbi:PHD finger protein ALFIN-LIKE 5 [Forsythia ovata]|uniref:PHD finger protein ALFIN-LIKE n=1 Tax=Forsythia ovata TaxID=205694 RepID=A0ABD1QN56_9LAMI